MTRPLKVQSSLLFFVVLLLCTLGSLCITTAQRIEVTATATASASVSGPIQVVLHFNTTRVIPSAFALAPKNCPTADLFTSAGGAWSGLHYWSACSGKSGVMSHYSGNAYGCTLNFHLPYIHDDDEVVCWFQWDASFTAPTTLSLELVDDEEFPGLFTLVEPLKLTPPVTWATPSTEAPAEPTTPTYTLGNITAHFSQGTDLLYPGALLNMTKDQIVLNVDGARLESFAQYQVKLHYYRDGNAFHNIVETLYRFHTTNASIAQDIRLFVVGGDAWLITGAAPATEFVIKFDFSNFVQQFEIPQPLEDDVISDPTVSILAEIIDLAGNGHITALTDPIPTFSEADKAAHIPLAHGVPTISSYFGAQTFEVAFSFSIYPKGNNVTIEVSELWPDTAAFDGYDAFMNHFDGMALFQFSCTNRSTDSFSPGTRTVHCFDTTPNKHMQLRMIVTMKRSDVHPFKIPITIDGALTVLDFAPSLTIGQQQSITEFTNDHVAFTVVGEFGSSFVLPERDGAQVGRVSWNTTAVFDTSIVYNLDNDGNPSVLLDDTLNCTATIQHSSDSELLPLTVNNITNNKSEYMFIDKHVVIPHARPGSRVVLYCYNNINQFNKPWLTKDFFAKMHVTTPHSHVDGVELRRNRSTSPNEDWLYYNSTLLQDALRLGMVFSAPPTTIAEAKERVVAFLHTATPSPGADLAFNNWKDITTNDVWVVEVDQFGHDLAKFQPLVHPTYNITQLYDINNAHFPAHQLFGGVDNRIWMLFYVNTTGHSGLSYDLPWYKFKTAHPNDVYLLQAYRSATLSVTPQEERRYVIPTTSAEVSGNPRTLYHGAKCFSSRPCYDGYCVNGTCHTAGIPLVWSPYSAGVFSGLGPFVDMTDVYNMIKTTPAPYPGETTPSAAEEEEEEEEETDGGNGGGDGNNNENNNSADVAQIYCAIVMSCIVAIAAPMLF